MNIKKGDNILVIAGKDKGKTGKVLDVNPKTNKVTVENVNVVTKHQNLDLNKIKAALSKDCSYGSIKHYGCLPKLWQSNTCCSH